MDQAHQTIEAVAPVGVVAAVFNILTTLHPLITFVSLVYMLVYIYDRWVFHRRTKREKSGE